jgi:hypothetical protein
MCVKQINMFKYLLEAFIHQATDLRSYGLVHSVQEIPVTLCGAFYVVIKFTLCMCSDGLVLPQFTISGIFTKLRDLYERVPETAVSTHHPLNLCSGF